MELCVSIAGGGTCCLVYGTLLKVYISICFHHQAFYEIFSHLVRKFDRLDENQNRQKNICELVRFHSVAKKLVWPMVSQLWKNF